MPLINTFTAPLVMVLYCRPWRPKGGRLQRKKGKIMNDINKLLDRQKHYTDRIHSQLNASIVDFETIWRDLVLVRGEGGTSFCSDLLHSIHALKDIKQDVEILAGNISVEGSEAQS